ncbi:MAG: LysR family transcriptional regulator [Polyangiaceae bacterium]
MNWEDARLFLAVAETGSMSAAARRLGSSQPTVSRRLAELESRLGEPLFERGVDGVRVTPYAERLAEPARRMAEWAAEFERAAERTDASPRGLVRITAPPGIAFDFLAPFAAWLRKEQPSITLQVISTVRYLDLGRREADIALRGDHLAQRELETLVTREFEGAAFATPEYIRSLPPNFKLADIAWIGWQSDEISPNRELASRIPGFVPAFASDDFIVQLQAAECGAGVIFLGRVRHRFSRPSKLVELDVGVGPIRQRLALVAARSALDIPRVRIVAELLADAVRKAETPDKPPARHDKTNRVASRT